MISKKKNIIISFIVILGFVHHISYSMEKSTETKIKLENRKIRKRLHSIKKLALQTVEETEKNKSQAKCKHNDETLTSNDGRSQHVTIYIPEEEVQYHRTYKQFIQLMQEATSDDEVEDTFAHSNQEDGPIDDTQQFLNNGKKEKKCCCGLI